MSEAVRYETSSGEGDAAFRFCLDLNVWCAWALSRSKGRSGTAAQLVVEAVRQGNSSLGEIQLVVSWAMLTRLRSVMVHDLRLEIGRTERLLADIISTAQLGPREVPPYVLLGGTGVVPLRDTEDLHVLEVAIAGRADVLVTSNFSDFVSYRTEILKPGSIARYRTADHEIIIARPAEVAEWIRTGAIDLGR